MATWERDARGLDDFRVVVTTLGCAGELEIISETGRPPEEREAIRR
jgi:hypothetical protein